MLNFFRKNQTARTWMIWIVVALLASYVLMSFGSAPPVAQGDTVAKVGSTRIKLSDAWILQTDMRRQFGRFDKNVIDNFAVNRLVNTAVLLDAANDLGLEVSDEELRDLVISYRSRPDGTFVEEEEWRDWIQYNYQIQVPSYEQYLRDNILRSSKFNRLFFDAAYVSETDAEEKFIEDNSQVKLEMLILNTNDVRNQATMSDDKEIAKLVEENPDEFKTGDLRKIRFVRFPFNDFDNVEITEAQIKTYYDENQARYVRREATLASHILFQLADRTEAEAVELANKVKAEIDGGLSFDEAVTKYSEDTTSKNRKGNLGYMQKGGSMGPVFDEALWAMEDGQISAPVTTTRGVHLIRKDKYRAESQVPLEEAKVGITSILKNQEKRNKAMSMAGEFHQKLVDGGDFESVAKEMNYEVNTSDFFDNNNRSNLGEILKNNSFARNATFALENINDYSGPVSMSREAGVVQWIEEAPPRVMNMDQDAARIRILANAVAQKAMINKVMEELRGLATASPDKTFKELLGERDYLKENHFRTTDWVNATTMPMELRNAVDFQADIFSQEPGTILAETETENADRYVLTKVLEKQDADMGKFAEERADIIERMRSDAATDLLAGYVYAAQQKLDPNNEVRSKITEALSKR